MSISDVESITIHSMPHPVPLIIHESVIFPDTPQRDYLFGCYLLGRFTGDLDSYPLILAQAELCQRFDHPLLVNSFLEGLQPSVHLRGRACPRRWTASFSSSGAVSTAGLSSNASTTIVATAITSHPDFTQNVPGVKDICPAVTSP